MAKIKAEWREIAIPGQREAFVAVIDGKEAGTIARVDRRSPWTVYRGIGPEARMIGKSYGKEGAKYLLLDPTAPGQ